MEKLINQLKEIAKAQHDSDPSHSLDEYAVYQAAEKIQELQSRLAEVEKENRALLIYYVDASRWFSRHDPNGYISPAQDDAEEALVALKRRTGAEAVRKILELDTGYIQVEEGSFAYHEYAISGFAESIESGEVEL